MLTALRFHRRRGNRASGWPKNKASGTQTLEWELEQGDWTVVIMNADASAPVAATMSVGARFGILTPIVIGLTAGGVVLAGDRDHTHRPRRPAATASPRAAPTRGDPHTAARAGPAMTVSPQIEVHARELLDRMSAGRETPPARRIPGPLQGHARCGRRRLHAAALLGRRRSPAGSWRAPLRRRSSRRRSRRVHVLSRCHGKSRQLRLRRWRSA